MGDQQVQTLQIDLLAAGDRPSILILGLVASRLLQNHKLAVLAVDALGHVQFLLPDAVKLLVPVRVPIEDLNKLDEMDAIRVLLAQGDSEDEIEKYLHHREESV